jgi:hypothetical protein
MTAVDESVTTDRAELNEYIGRHIRYYRERAHLSQVEVTSDGSASTLRRCRRGRRVAWLRRWRLWWLSLTSSGSLQGCCYRKAVCDG